MRATRSTSRRASSSARLRHRLRVALRNRVDYTFGQAVGLSNQWITARARAGASGGLLPIAVREFIGLPGPNKAPAYPCSNAGNHVHGGVRDREHLVLRSTPRRRPRRPRGPVRGRRLQHRHPDNDRDHHGPIVEILGQGADPGQRGGLPRASSPWTSATSPPRTSQRFFNGVTSGTSSNSLKDIAGRLDPARRLSRARVPDRGLRRPIPNLQVALDERQLRGHLRRRRRGPLRARRRGADPRLPRLHDGHPGVRARDPEPDLARRPRARRR